MVNRLPDPTTMNAMLPPLTEGVASYRIGQQVGVCTDIVARNDEARRYGRIRQTENGYVAFAADGDTLGRFKVFQDAAEAIARWGVLHVDRRWLRSAVSRAAPAPAVTAPPLPKIEKLCVDDLAALTVPELRGALAGLFTRSFREARRAEIVALIVERAGGARVPFFWRKRRTDLLGRLDRLGVPKAGMILARLTA